MNTSSDLSSSPLLGPIGRNWWVLLLYGIVAIIFGLIAVTHPLAAAAALAWGMGILALIEAGISLAALFTKSVSVSKGWLALYAVLSFLFGALALMNPLAMAGAMIFFLAAWLIVAGVYRIVFAIQVRKAIEGEWLLILSGLLAIVLGVLFAINPLSGMVVTSLWIGVCALIYGVFQIFVAFKVRRLT